jgi:hydrogenase nickel incorporation protein HypB
MCATCGCGDDAEVRVHGPGGHAHGGHAHDHQDGASRTVMLQQKVLAKNDRLAERNRDWLRDRGILAVNLMSSPGAGKTTLLEKTLQALGKKYLLGIIEGDMATSNDAKRVRKYAKPGAVYQVKTENFGGGCHLDEGMVATGLKKIRSSIRKYDAVIIENVGNLICPADFNLGENKKAVMLSVTEGDDKPLKYPVIFRAADLVIISKTDLLKHTDFSLKKAKINIKRVNPSTAILDISASKKGSLSAWYKTLESWILGNRNSPYI